MRRPACCRWVAIVTGCTGHGRTGQLFGLSERQLQRLKARWRQSCVRASSSWRARYAGFNQQPLTEKLKEDQQLRLDRSTDRRVLRKAGVRSPPFTSLAGGANACRGQSCCCRRMPATSVARAQINRFCWPVACHDHEISRARPVQSSSAPPSIIRSFRSGPSIVGGNSRRLMNRPERHLGHASGRVDMGTPHGALISVASAGCGKA